MLAIAGSDPSGGAGIQADLKSIAANGGYGMAAITALTAQNTQGVRAVHVPPAAFLTAQLDAISDDIGIDAVKIGMLGDAAVIDAVRSWLEKVRPAVVVLDPVMVATSGDRLLQESAEAALQALLPLADLITPNLAELAILLKEPVAADWSEALAQGKRLAALTGTTVLVKGGHLQGGGPGDGHAHGACADGHAAGNGAADGCPDALVNTGGLLGQETVVVPGERIATRNSHGTGCSLSSAMATVQARVGDWEAALREVKPWLLGALREASALDVGTGNGPVHHFHHLQHLQGGQALKDGQRGQHRPAGHGPAAGEFAAALRAGAAGDLEAIYALDFVRGLADGTLPEHEFAYYLAQDAIYLNGYSRVLARAAAIAPTEAEQLFWARSAQTCLEVESELHRSWLSTRPTASTLGPVTKVVRGPPAGRLGLRQLRRPRGGGAARASGSTPRSVPPCTGSSWPAAPPGRTPTPAGCGPTPTRTSPPRPGRPSRTRTRRPGGHRRASGRPWPWPSGSHRATKWTSSTRRGCTPDASWSGLPVRWWGTVPEVVAATQLRMVKIPAKNIGGDLCIKTLWRLSRTTRRNQPHLRPKAKLAYSRSSVLTPTLGL